MMPRHGVLGFLLITFVCTWFPAWLLRDAVGVGQFSMPWRFFISTLLYVSIMGWQPLIAVMLTRRYLEPEIELNAGLRSTSEKFVVLAVLLPTLAMIGASCLQLLFADRLTMALSAPSAPLAAGILPSLLAITLVLAAAGLIYCQCVIEEIAWRGYLLVRMMELAGPWRGLIAHGAIWGVWYAPILILGGAAPGSHPYLHAAEFTVTCTLLGILLGWLRLASQSILPAVIANASLTVGAGLPLMLNGMAIGARCAVYLPIGWVPLLAVTCWLAFTRRRAAVVTPRPPPKPNRRWSPALH